MSKTLTAENDALTTMIVDAAVTILEQQKRVTFRDVMAKLLWSTSRIAEIDWPALKVIVEKKLGASKSLPRWELVPVPNLYLQWLDATDAQRTKFSRNGKDIITPATHAEIFCPVNKRADAWVTIDTVTEEMREYLASNRRNHIGGRVNGARRLGKTAEAEGLSIASLEPRALVNEVIQIVGLPPKKIAGTVDAPATIDGPKN
jgi:hypothetical protein